MKTRELKKYSAYFATENEQQVSIIKKITCNIFGGYSLHSINGGWIDSDNGKLLEEPSYYLEVLTDKDIKHMKDLCDAITIIANQKAVFYFEQDIKLNTITNKKN